MPPGRLAITPNMQTFLASLKGNSANDSVDHLVSLLKRRQIQNSRPCAIATTHLLLRVVAEVKFKSISQLTDRIRVVGRQLCDAQPRELTIGNVVRRVLGLVREITESENELELDGAEGSQKTLLANAQSSVLPESLFTLMANPGLIATDQSQSLPTEGNSQPKSNGNAELNGPISMQDVKDDVLNGIREVLDELDQADEQIAGYGVEHIHPNETILTTAASTTVHKFLLSAAKKRRFSVIYVESYPNEHKNTHQIVVSGGKKDPIGGTENENRHKSLVSAGIQVIVIPDSNIWTVMTQVDQVFLAAHSVFSNGACTASAGARMIAKAANMHRIPVTLLSGVFKFSPVFGLDNEDSVEYGDPGKVLDFRSGSTTENIETINPLQDYIPPSLVTLYISNLGGHTPSNVYRIVADHYHEDDIDL